MEKTEGPGEAERISQSAVVTELALPEAEKEPDMEQESLSSSDMLSYWTEEV